MLITMFVTLIAELQIVPAYVCMCYAVLISEIDSDTLLWGDADGDAYI